MEITKVGVIGAGQMGGGIVQVIASAGVPVVWYNHRISTLEKGLAKIEKGLDKLVEKEKIDGAQKQAILANISLSEKLEDLADCNFLNETIVEEEATKLDYYARLNNIVSDDAIMTSNTSTISITRLAAAYKKPERFLGFHFMNPAQVMKLVEVIRGLRTDEGVFATAVAFAEKIGKVPVPANDSPGFVVNRILFPMINEAINVLETGVASATDIDEAMKLGANMPIGPLALADLVGLDITLKILDILKAEFGDSACTPSPTLRKYVAAGLLGRKSGRGFHDYSK